MSPATSKQVRSAVSAVIIAALALLVLWMQNPDTGQGLADLDPDSGLAWIDVAALTVEGRDTLALIDAGGPFPYPDHDGGVFGNYEQVLPVEPRGYYREFTVPTPGESDRGARRIVVGDGGEFYWTDDHYQTFSRIRR